MFSNGRVEPAPIILPNIAWTADVFLAFGIVLSMFPVGGPNPSNENTNYTVVINFAVWEVRWGIIL